jgi:hypothetical protein
MLIEIAIIAALETSFPAIMLSLSPVEALVLLIICYPSALTAIELYMIWELVVLQKRIRDSKNG